ncbi:MAG: hypothetical protein ABIC91_07325 [Nanoarchaeota archaeon]|nr:hypothetical protein [Nanoarchaeota archaeon]MBU1031214.1 hypothetical protein [Nanoarchaeota archaeon]MBU1849208.1 hypothetical protein [Nanoarchaeota archaeon]
MERNTFNDLIGDRVALVAMTFGKYSKACDLPKACDMPKNATLGDYLTVIQTYTFKYNGLKNLNCTKKLVVMMFVLNLLMFLKAFGDQKSFIPEFENSKTTNLLIQKLKLIKLVSGKKLLMNNIAML